MADRQADELLGLYAAMLGADSAPMRRIAVWEIGRLGDARGAGHLIRAITEDPDWECRHYAVMALANVGGLAEAQQLRACVADGYLVGGLHGCAGPAPEGLVEHLAEDIEYAAKCCAGELPRPAEAEDRHGEWWRG